MAIMKALRSTQPALLWHPQEQPANLHNLTGNVHCKMRHGIYLGAFLDSILYEFCNLLS